MTPRDVLYQTNANRRSTPVPVADILRFELISKYAVAITATSAYPLRTSIRALQSEFGAEFVLVSARHLVRSGAIERIVVDAADRLYVQVQGARDMVPLWRSRLADVKRRCDYLSLARAAAVWTEPATGFVEL